MEPESSELLNSFATRLETLEAQRDVIREFALDQTRTSIEAIYGEETAQAINLEVFTIRDLLHFQKAEEITANYDGLYYDVLKTVKEIGAIEKPKLEYDYGSQFDEELPLTLLFAIVAHYKVADSEEHPPQHTEFLEAYLDTRIAELRDETEPSDEESTAGL